MTGAAIIRRFQEGDAGPTHDVFYDAVRVGAASHYREADLIDWAPAREMPDDWGDWLGGHFTVVGEVEGRVAGFFMLEQTGYLNMAFVRPEYRRSGLAQRLYDAILDEARRQSMPRLTVWASRLAQPFLRRNGWVIDHDPPHLEGHPVLTDDPEPLDVAMKLDLDPAP